MANSNALVLADDATGALECASLLAGLRLRVLIAITETPATREAESIQVVDTESRHLLPEQAAARMRHWLKGPDSNIFKKTDSTLRGNIAAELHAMLELPGARTIVYVPAYPALGRSVVDGQLLVHGVPVANTEFARDARESVGSSRIVDLFPQSVRGRIVSIPDAHALSNALREDTPRILVCDAVSNEDFDLLAAAIRGTPKRPWVASPAGFIPSWAALNEFAPHDPPVLPQRRKWLVVCGSRHPRSRRQARIAEALGIPVILSSEETHESPEVVADNLARQALASIQKDKFDAVLIMGGDTVWALWRAMGITSILPLPEVLPGVAACLSPEQDLLFVTKAGGFGDDRLVDEVLMRCNRT